MTGKPKRTGVAIALGVALGAAFGVAAGHVAIWVAAGVAVGLAMGGVFRGRGIECAECAAIRRKHEAGMRQLES